MSFDSSVEHDRPEQGSAPSNAPLSGITSSLSLTGVSEFDIESIYQPRTHGPWTSGGFARTNPVTARTSTKTIMCLAMEKVHSMKLISRNSMMVKSCGTAKLVGLPQQCTNFVVTRDCIQLHTEQIRRASILTTELFTL
jgi:hypothetical protein